MENFNDFTLGDSLEGLTILLESEKDLMTLNSTSKYYISSVRCLTIKEAKNPEEQKLRTLGRFFYIVVLGFSSWYNSWIDSTLITVIVAVVLMFLVLMGDALNDRGEISFTVGSDRIILKYYFDNQEKAKRFKKVIEEYLGKKEVTEKIHSIETSFNSVRARIPPPLQVAG